jgi:hypothetical protein
MLLLILCSVSMTLCYAVLRCAVRLQVNFEGRLTGPEALVAAVEECGFDCRLQSVHNVDADDDDDDRPQVSGWGGEGGSWGAPRWMGLMGPPVLWR